MIYFTSDTHYGHANVLEFDARPFASIEEHDEQLIARYNAVVRPEDTCIHVGDFCLASSEYAESVCKRLNGTKILVHGNHDGSHAKMARIGFTFVTDQLVMHMGGRKVTVVHRPQDVMRSTGQVVVHGHTHTKSRFGTSGFVHVGVVAWDYTPASYDEVASLCEQA